MKVGIYILTTLKIVDSILGFIRFNYFMNEILDIPDIYFLFRIVLPILLIGLLISCGIKDWGGNKRLILTSALLTISCYLFDFNNILKFAF